EVVEHYGLAVAGFDVADHPWLLATGLQVLDYALLVVFGHADNHAYAAVQYTVHFSFIDVAVFLHPIKYHRTGPAGYIHHGLTVVGQHAGDVFQQAATGDVGNGFDCAGFLDQLEHRLDVNAGRLQQQLDQWFAVHLSGVDVGTGDFDDFANQ